MASGLVAKKGIRKFFAERGLTETEAARFAGLARQTMRKLVAGELCTPKVAKRFCDAFEINMWDYFDFIEEE